MDKGANMISSAIVGFDCRTCLIDNKCYVIQPPTIARISGAGHYLSGIRNGDTVKDLILSMQDMDNIAYALSWFIAGDESLAEDFKKADINEVIEGLNIAFSLISVENFLKLSVLMRNVLNLIAKQK